MNENIEKELKVNDFKISPKKQFYLSLSVLIATVILTPTLTIWLNWWIANKQYDIAVENFEQRVVEHNTKVENDVKSIQLENKRLKNEVERLEFEKSKFIKLIEKNSESLEKELSQNREIIEKQLTENRKLMFDRINEEFSNWQKQYTVDQIFKQKNKKKKLIMIY